MQVDIIDGKICIDIHDYITELPKEEKIALLNNLKVQDDFFQIFMEMFAGDDTINNPSCWTTNVYEWRKQMLNMAAKKFSEDIEHLSIINELERKYKQYLSNERLYWNIYQDAPQYIREYFQYKIDYDYKEEGKQFRQEVLETILKN